MTLEQDVELWLVAYADTTEALTTSAVSQALHEWSRFTRWYNDEAVAALAASLAQVSQQQQQQMAGAAAAYVAAVTSLMGVPGIPAPQVPFTVIRNGVPSTLVHTRPAEAYRRAVALGATHAEALAKAGIRAQGVMGSDLTLQQREAERMTMERAGVTGYRRIIRPEMSKSGTCGLCIAAADRIYSTGELMPIHPPSCNCTVMPIVGDADPGLRLNQDDIGQLYADAGSTAAAALARTRYTVNTHGEYGPVLTRQGDSFRGPDRVALEDDVPRVLRLLEKATPVLQAMEAGQWDGVDRDDAVAYQRSFVDRLEHIAATAA